MKKERWYFWIILVLLTACQTKTAKKTKGRPLPQAVFITTGIDFDHPPVDLPGSARVAVNAFNSQGIPLRFETRDILYHPEELKKYKFLILSTAKGIHDADRPFSLSYMNDEELNVLRDFVKNGGVLIAGDNVGRNDYEGNDRILKTGSLDPAGYPLSEVFGVILKERNFKSYDLVNNRYEEWFLAKDYDLWTTYPDSLISNNAEILAYWIQANDTVPAMIRNTFGQGSAWLLPVSDILNPAQTGGYVSVRQIENLYKKIIDTETKNLPQIWFWPDAKQGAFAITFNDLGSDSQYRFLLKKLKENNLKAEFFVHGKLNDTLKQLLTDTRFPLSTTGQHYIRFSSLDYSDATHEWLAPRLRWDYPFKGFRFPFTDPSFTGLQAADLNGFQYDSSISADEPGQAPGTFYPYNITYSGNDFYHATSILEIPPVYHDDFFFLDEYIRKFPVNPYDTKNIEIFRQYLLDYWKLNVEPVSGLMVYLGHPAFTGFNDKTFLPLQTVIDTLRTKNVWFTTPSEINRYRKDLKQTSITFKQTKQHTEIYLSHPRQIPGGLTLLLPPSAKNIRTKNMKTEIKKDKQGIWLIIRSANNEATIDYDF